jgi:deoxycytidine triphosphate deaminase
MSIKPDHWIEKMAREHGMIEPFEAGQVSEGVISYGVSSYGYDIRVADEFKIFTNVNNTVVDPKHFDNRSFVEFKGDICTIPPNSFALARTVEYFRIPRDILTICLGKSTYARCGIIVNVTPFEPCFSADTEILTRNGWQTLDRVLIGTEVLTMNDEGIAEWQRVERFQAYPYKGDMLHFDGRSVDLLVTPDHQLYVDLRSNSRRNEWKGWHRKKAGEVFGKHNHRMSRQIVWQGTDIGDQVEIGDQVYDTNTFLNFFGVYLGDGSCYVNKRGYVIKLAALNECGYNRCRDLILAMGHKPNYDGRSWCFFSKSLYEFLHPLGHAQDKYIPRWVKDLPRYRLEHLLNGLMAADGNEQTRTYTTASQRLADDVQEIMFKVGTAAIVRKVGVVQGNFKGSLPIFKVRQAVKHLTPKIAPSRHKRVPYSGMVYDVTVPNHIIFVRRNGKAVWSGNCWEGFVTLEISNTTPLPARIYANEGIAQVVFFQADEECRTSYADKKGKYQKQMGITLPKIDQK